MKRILYARHSDGRKLYLPQWNDDGEIIDYRVDTAAISIDRDSVCTSGPVRYE